MFEYWLGDGKIYLTGAPITEPAPSPLYPSPAAAGDEDRDADIDADAVADIVVTADVDAVADGNGPLSGRIGPYRAVVGP